MPEKVIESGSPEAAEVFSFFEICTLEDQLLEKIPRNTWKLVEKLKNYTDAQEVVVFAYFPELAKSQDGDTKPVVALVRHAMGKGLPSKVAKAIEDSPACVPDQAAIAMLQERLQLVFERTRLQAVHVACLFDTDGGKVGGGLSINPANQPEPQRLLMLGGAIAGHGEMLQDRARKAANLEFGPAPGIIMPGDPGFKV